MSNSTSLQPQDSPEVSTQDSPQVPHQVSPQVPPEVPPSSSPSQPEVWSEVSSQVSSQVWPGSVSAQTLDRSGVSHSEPPLCEKSLVESGLSQTEASQFYSASGTKHSSVLETSMCRICHEGGLQEALLSPCECLGTMARIHRSCLEHWLSASGTSVCELCNHQFKVQKKARPLLEWLQNPRLQQEKRTLCGDVLCFLLITPLASVSGWLCLRGAVDHLHLSSRLEALGLIALTVALFSIYLFWTLVSLRYHCRLYTEWRQSNQRVVLLLPHSDRVLQHLSKESRESRESIV